MNSINSVVLSGIVGTMYISYTQKGTCAISFKLEVRRQYKENTYKSWIPIKMWGETAELAKMSFAEGSHIIVTGTIDSSTYDKNGTQTSRVDVTARQFFLAGADQFVNQQPAPAPRAQFPEQQQPQQPAGYQAPAPGAMYLDPFQQSIYEDVQNANLANVPF